ncbi:MAG: hypothetical protein NT124_00545 [Candidatus Dependentiae bacterium]|nr:hypothetical protein [Candidatus Dependentiae bacterium]
MIDKKQVLLCMLLISTSIKPALTKTKHSTSKHSSKHKQSLITTTTQVGTYPGSLDGSFGNGQGIVISKRGQLFGVATQANNNIVVAGDDIHPSSMVAYAVEINKLDEDIYLAGSVNNDFAVARLNSAGTLDNSFGGSTTGLAITSFGANTTSQAHAIALDVNNNNNSAIVVGGFAQTAGNKKFALARYRIDNGALVWKTNISPFTQNNPLEQINGVAIDQQSRIVVAGQTVINDQQRFVLARYNITNGALDTSFGNQGRIVANFGSINQNDTAQAVSINLQNQIIAAGFAQSPSQEALPVALFYSDGTLDASFGQSREGRRCFALASYNNQGQPNNNFGTYIGTELTPIGTSANEGNALALYITGPNAGKIVVAGVTTTVLSKSKTAIACFAIARYDVNGQLDTTFGDSDGNGQRTGTVITSFNAENALATGVTIDSNNKIVVVGYVMHNGVPHMALARYNS